MVDSYELGVLDNSWVDNCVIYSACLDIEAGDKENPYVKIFANKYCIKNKYVPKCFAISGLFTTFAPVIVTDSYESASHGLLCGGGRYDLYP